ncbi:hypothetical protein FB451DRAFT_446356 [Mycena latifolia]|nr:hypothetical protein FB451DRAFT_446356 [Mycena latifolia]
MSVIENPAPCHIDRVPNDVLTHLFRFCLPIFNDPKLKKEWLRDEPQNSFSLNKHIAPLLLCNICRGWRDLAIALPELWTVIHYECDYDSRGPRRRTLKFLDTWLTRSGRLPLAVYSNSPKVHEQFVLHAERIRRISVMAYSWRERDVPRAFRSGSFPLIESIDIKSDLPPNLYSSLIRAPRLKEVVWFLGSWADRAGSLENLPPFPWARLTKAAITTGITVHQARNILLKCTSLVECIFSVSGAIDFFGGEWSHVTHHRVTSLRIQMDSQLGLSDFFHRLTLPALHTLGLTFDDSKGLRFETINMWDADSQGWEAFLAFLRSSNCELTSLELTRWGLVENMVIELLEIVSPSLEELSINGFDAYDEEEFEMRHEFGTEDDPPVSISDRALARLTYTGPAQTPPCLCPKLVSLHLDNSIECDEDVLRAMVVSRQAGGMIAVLPLEAVEIRMLERPDFNDEEDEDDPDDDDEDDDEGEWKDTNSE